MKFFFDNNISYRYAKMLSALGRDVIGLRELYDPKISDIDVLEDLRGSDYVFVTAERKMRGRPAEVDALKRSGMTCLFFGPFFSDKMTFWKQAEWIIRRWPTIENFAEGSKKGTCAIVQQNGKSAPIQLKSVNR